MTVLFTHNIVTVDAKCHTLKANASLNTFPPFSLVCSVPSRAEGEGGTNYRDPGPDCVAYVFVFRGNIIRNDPGDFVVLTVLSASGHLA